MFFFFKSLWPMGKFLPMLGVFGTVPVKVPVRETHHRKPVAFIKQKMKSRLKCMHFAQRKQDFRLAEDSDVMSLYSISPIN